MAYHKLEQYDTDTTQTLSDIYHTVLQQIGEDPQREGLMKTPARIPG
ncbi:MAG: hypothetical protein AAFU03_16550 [Bacteroidota bacterium]